MHFLAHRGLWTRPEEKNSAAALAGSFAAGFGVETDLRDAGGRLVISHDPAGAGALEAAEFFRLHAAAGGLRTLALNIKADGLHRLLRPLLEQHRITDYFCFDMSVPENLVYRRNGLRFFTRESEFERTPALYADAAGVWLDQFLSDWITPADVARHRQAGKQIAIVSPELHGRPHLAFWQLLRDAGPLAHEGVFLCTDYPIAAQKFFS